MASVEPMGEPYELDGKRMAFMGWQFIRPADFGWFDDQGVNVAVVGNQGPWDAHFRLTDRPFGIAIRALPAERSAAPLTLDAVEPWEREGVRFEQFVQDSDAGCYRCWGRCRAGGQERMCYLESTDFQTWRRPRLGIVEFEGSRDNNLIQTDGGFGNIFKDPSRPDEPWKWIREAQITRAQYDAFRAKYPTQYDPKSDRQDVPQNGDNLIVAVKGGVSPDGFRWTTLEEPLVVEHSDTRVNAYYDTRLEKYVGYFRDWMVERRSPQAAPTRAPSWLPSRRSIGRAVTDDFRHFPLSEVILEPGPEHLGPSDLIYTNAHTFVPGTRDQHLFLPVIWRATDDTSNMVVLSSSDGRLMHWLDGSPVLDTAAFGTWDGGCLFEAGGLLELPDGTWAQPYHGHNFPHKYPRKGPITKGLGLARWPKGRMVALEARELGEFTTFAVMPPGRRLRINALTRRAGSVRVEVTGLDRKMLPGRSFDDCRPIIGDQYRTLVTWNGSDDIGVSAGTPICLRFRLDQAQLFFVDFE